MNPNSHKVITVTDNQLIISYTDSGKVRRVRYQPSVEGRSQSMARKHRNVQLYQELNLNQKQHWLYNLYVHQHSNPEVMSMLPLREKARVKDKQRKVQEQFNIWKQQLANKATDDLLKAIFPHSSLVSNITAGDYTDEHWESKFSFHELGIGKGEIVDKLIEWNILPRNFYSLN